MKGTSKFWVCMVALLAAIATILVFSTPPQPAVGQSVDFSTSENTVTSTVDADEEAGTISPQGAGAVSVLVTGTWVATFIPEVSVDGTTYVATEMYEVPTREPRASRTTNGTFIIRDTAGMKSVRLRADAYTSGTATVKLTASRNTANFALSRPVNVVKAISDTGGGLTTDLTIWTPASGKKARISGVSIMTTVDTTITLRYGSAATNLALWPVQTGLSERDLILNFGDPGFLVDTDDATVYIVRGAATILGGAIWGREEE